MSRVAWNRRMFWVCAVLFVAMVILVPVGVAKLIGGDLAGLGYLAAGMLAWVGRWLVPGPSDAEGNV